MENTTSGVLKELAPTGKLRVALAVSSAGGPFWCARDAAGALNGVPVVLGGALAQQLGVPADFIAYENSGRITEAAARDEWDVTFVPMDAERAKKLTFGTIYNLAEGTFIVRPGITAGNFDELDQTGVDAAAVADTTTMRGASRALNRATIESYQSYESILADLKAGRIDAFAFSRDNLNRLAATIPATRVLPGAFQQTKTAIAVPPGRPEALACAIRFMEAAKTNGLLRRALDDNGLNDTPIP